MNPPSTHLRGLVMDIDRFATHDGPGIRTAVFLKGCALRCAWCHSPESQSFTAELLFMPNRCTACGLCLAVCPHGALSALAPDDGRCRVALDRALCDDCGACADVCYPDALKLAGEWWQADALAEEVSKNKAFFQASGGGVTLTGGEASHQPDFSIAFLTACKRLGISTALETNGAAPWRVLARLADVTDLFLFDLKHMDPAEHRRLTGVSPRTPHANLRRLAQRGARIIVRVPCIPGINDAPANLRATAAFVRQLGLSTIHLLPYNAAAGAKYAWLGKPYQLSDLSPQSPETMQSLAEICREEGVDVVIG